MGALKLENFYPKYFSFKNALYLIFYRSGTSKSCITRKLRVPNGVAPTGAFDFIITGMNSILPYFQANPSESHFP